MDVGIVVDSSSSVTRGNFKLVKNFLTDLVDKLPVSARMTHVGVIHYNHKSKLDWGFKSVIAMNPASLKDGIKNVLEYEPGGTRTDKGMGMAWQDMFKPGQGARPDALHVMLVVTDGKTSKRSKPYPTVLKPFKVLK